MHFLLMVKKVVKMPVPKMVQLKIVRVVIHTWRGPASSFPLSQVNHLANDPAAIPSPPAHMLPPAPRAVGAVFSPSYSLHILGISCMYMHITHMM